MNEHENFGIEDTNSIGLCASCQHLLSQGTKRGAIFYRCGRADGDDRFLRYPPMPVLHCPGHERNLKKGGNAQSD